MPVDKEVQRINNKIQIVYNLVEIKSLLTLDSTVLNLQNEIIKRAKDHLSSLIARSQVKVFMVQIKLSEFMKP